MAKANETLAMWQERLAKCESAYSAEMEKMDRREALYRGSREILPLVDGDKTQFTRHQRKLCAELIEAEVDSEIPQPKVTARRKKDELKAKLIEDMLRNELDRLPFEVMNDMAERTVPIQGGGIWLVEWDSSVKTHTTSGELSVSFLHPKQVIPQDGIYTGIEDMDYIILKVPQTKEYLRRRYNVMLDDESESEPEVRGASGKEHASDDLVTQYMAYYRSENGGIGLYSWVNDTELVHLEDYQARILSRCKICGAYKPRTDEKESGQVLCPVCGANKWKESEEEFEELYMPVKRSDGSEIPGAEVFGDIVEPTRIPFYKPRIYPLILQKNVSLYGYFLGDSDIDKIEDQQNTYNRMAAKVADKLIKSGSYMTLPDDAVIETDTEELKIIRPGDAAKAALIGVYNMEGNVGQDMNFAANVYEEARQTIGITDSFQGRRDTTATSGTAKQFAAQQTAGRLESRRVMKRAAWANLFEAMFKFKLAYADEPRPVVCKDMTGNVRYEEFNRYDFLEKDETGKWYWNDEFLFSCDKSAPLARDNEAMWQETNAYFSAGAFGDPSQTETQILFWSKMESLHYPSAGETKRYLEEKLQREIAAREQAQLMASEQQRMADEQRKMQAYEAADRDAANAFMNELAASAGRVAKQDAERTSGKKR
ncbi:MAG: hypothetical protein ACI4RV_00070 [Eubacteriales bacterium]